MDIRLAIMQETSGSPMPSPNDIPSVMMTERASVNCRNGQTSTNRSSEAAAALAHLRSATSKCRAAAAAATSIITTAGSHSQLRTSDSEAASEGPASTIHER